MTPAPRWRRVRSSTLHSIAHDRATGELRVAFRAPKGHPERGGSTYLWELSSVIVSGANQDLLTVAGNLALGATVGNPMTIDIASLGMLNFSNTASYNWTIASSTGGAISGFDGTG